MVKLFKRIPAGNLLIPMFISAVLYTLWPNLFKIGGLTQATLGGSGINFIIGALTFCSGTGIQVSQLGKIVRRHGLLILIKILIGIVMSIIAFKFLPTHGIFGLTPLTIMIGLISCNPALYLSLVTEFGEEEDKAAFGLLGIFSLPILPMIILSMILGSGTFDFTPIFSALLPLALGMVLGNVDPESQTLFSPGIGMLMPFLGWSLGQSLHLVQAVEAIVPGVLLTIAYYLVNAILVMIDRKVLKEDGVVPIAMYGIAGISGSLPLIIADTYPEFLPYVQGATSQILAGTLITSILTPMILNKFARKTNKL